MIFSDELTEKIDAAEELIAHIEKMSEQNVRSVKICAILKSSLILLLYNTIESTITSILTSIHDELKNHSFHPLSKKIKKIYTEYHFSGSKTNLMETIEKTISSQLKSPTLEEYTKIKKIYSGNLDSRKIDEILASYGISPTKNRHKKLLLTIKEKRNKLAHGEQSFNEACRSLTLRELRELKKATDETMKECILLANQFLTSQGYMQSA